MTTPSSQKIHELEKRIQELESALTDAKGREKDSFDRETKYRMMVENAREAICVSQGGRIVFINPAFLNILGVQASDVLGKSIVDLVPPEYRTGILERMGSFQAGAELDTSQVLKILSKKGDVKWVSVNTVGIQWQGHRAGLLIASDVTESKLAELERETTVEFLGLVNEWHVKTELFEKILNFFKKHSGCDAAGIRLREGDDFPYYMTKGFPPQFILAEKYLCQREPGGSIALDGSGHAVLDCMCGNVIRGRTDPALPIFTQRGSFWTNGPTESWSTSTEKELQTFTRNGCNEEGYESVALIPIHFGEERLGLLQLNHHGKSAFTLRQIVLYEKLVDYLGVAIAQAQSKEALGESEETYRSLFENTLNGFAYCRMIFDDGEPADFLYLSVNQAFTSHTGLKDVVGKKASEVIPGIRESDRELLKTYGRVSLTGQPETFETYVKGLEMWFHISVYSPKKGYFAAVFDVITERKKMEESLRESESRIRSLVMGAPEGIFVQVDGQFAFVNPALMEILGATDALQLLGTDVLKRVDSPFHEMVQSRLQSSVGLLEGKRPKEMVWIRLDGAPVPVETSVVDLNYGGRNAHLVFVHNISNRKKMEEEKEKLQSALYHSQKLESVGRLAGGVAHDFNNMLTLILCNAEMALEQQAPGHPARENLVDIRKAALRSSDLTRQLLAFARKQLANPKVLNLNETLEGMLQLLRRLIGENIRLVWNPSENLWPVRVDPTQIDQILANLCINARDAIGETGTIQIETRAVRLDEAYCSLRPDLVPGDYALLSVTDDGCGMDAESLKKVFEPFYTTKAVGKGTGLGLATVYGIVKQNQGLITVYSEPGKGTNFKIYLPRHDEKAGLGQSEEAPAPPVRGHETILLVEDEPGILKIAKRMLEGLGYRVLAAPTPGEALRLAAENPGKIQLLVTDVVMSEMNGRELAQKLSAVLPDLKRLFMSGYSANIIAQQDLMEDRDRFLQKPFSVQELAAAVRDTLESGITEKNR